MFVLVDEVTTLLRLTDDEFAVHDLRFAVKERNRHQFERRRLLECHGGAVQFLHHLGGAHRARETVAQVLERVEFTAQQYPAAFLAVILDGIADGDGRRRRQ